MRQRNSLTIPSLSLVMPVYNQEKTIQKNIRVVEESLLRLGIPCELIVVVDGAKDNTAKKAREVQSKTVKILSYPENQGKGYAVKRGVLMAKGEIIGFIDGGMDLHPDGIAILLDYMKLHDADIVVGSKLHPDSEVYYPWQRKVLSFCYRTMTKLLFNLSIRDTQVGMKLFKRDVAKDIFPRNLVKKFAFDVETLAIAKTLGYTKIYEAPIKLEFKQKVSSITTTNFWKISLRMLLDTLGIFYRLRIKKSYRMDKA